MDPETNGWWKAEVIYNEATAERHRFMKDYKPEPGALIVIRDGRPTD